MELLEFVVEGTCATQESVYIDILETLTVILEGRRYWVKIREAKSCFPVDENYQKGNT